jgi:hypothetical protein
MNTHFSRILALYAALILLLFTACSVDPSRGGISGVAAPPPTPILPPAVMHYQDESFSFEYLENWKIFPPGDPTFTLLVDEIRPPGERVVGLSDPSRSGTSLSLLSAIAIYRYPGLPESEIEVFISDAYLNVNPTYGYQEVTEAVLLDSLPTIEKIYTIYMGAPAYGMHDLWFQKGDALFRMTIMMDYHNPEDEAAFNAQVKVVLDSLKVADVLPPLVVVPTMTPTPAPTAYPTSLLLHYEDEAVAFDYPLELKVHDAADASYVVYPDYQLAEEQMVGLGDPQFLTFDKYHRSISIYKMEVPKGGSIELIWMEAYNRIQDKYKPQESSFGRPTLINVNGYGTMQRTYRIYSGEPAYELRDLWMQRENAGYLISIWTIYTNPEDYARFQSGAEALLDSIVFK